MYFEQLAKKGCPSPPLTPKKLSKNAYPLQVNSAYDYTVKPWQFYMGCAGANRAPQFELNMEGSKLYMGVSI